MIDSDWKETVDEILSDPSMYPRLSEWETDFLESMMEWENDPTERQEEVLDRIFRKFGF